MMKRLAWQFGWMTVVSGLMWMGGAAQVCAAEEDPGGPGDRFQRLERRLNELAERQEQILRRLAAVPERPEQMAREMEAVRGRLGAVPGPGPERVRQRLPFDRPAAPAVARALKGIGDLAGLVMLVWLLANILLTVWIYTDIRKRGEGSGIFVALALVAGIPTALIYSLVRIGDKK